MGPGGGGPDDEEKNKNQKQKGDISNEVTKGTFLKSFDSFFPLLEDGQEMS
jgi:hypothetical protein